MSYPNPFSNFAYGELLQTLLPDFVLAFAFFTALCYAVLAKRFGQQRPAVAMSGAIGLALAIGLVWWEQAHDWSIRNLGSIAVGIALILLAMILYQAIKQVGGTWAGGGIALGASLLVAWILGAEWPVASDIMQTLVAVLLIGGIIAFLIHSRGKGLTLPIEPRSNSKGIGKGLAKLVAPRPAEWRHEIADARRERHVSKDLSRGFKRAEEKADHLHEHPEDAGNIMLQLQRMLPAEGWLTERLSGLRAKIQRLQQGQFDQVQEIQSELRRLDPRQREQAVKELTKGYKELRLDVRLERLDRQVAETEKRIMGLTSQAEARLAEHDYRQLHSILEEARQLQVHNSKLIKHLRQTEEQIAHVARQVAHAQHKAEKSK